MSEIKNFICFDENIYREKEITINVLGHDNWTVTTDNYTAYDLDELNPIQKMTIKRKVTKKIKEIGKEGGLVCSIMLPISGASFQNIVVTQSSILLSSDFSLINSAVKQEDLKQLDQDNRQNCRKNLCSANSYSEIEQDLITTANTYYRLLKENSGSCRDYVDILMYLNYRMTPNSDVLYTRSEQKVKGLNKNLR